MTPNVKLWRHLYVNLKLLNLPIFYTVFKITFQGKLIAEKIFFLYRKYKLRYAIFWIWKHSLGSNGVSPFYNRFYCRVVNTFKVYTTHIYCQKLAEKKKIKKGILNYTKSRKKDLKHHKISCDHFFRIFFWNLCFGIKRRKSKKTQFWASMKSFFNEKFKRIFF